MKKLYFLRHAKSGYPEGVEDHDRPLNAKGRSAMLHLTAYAKKHIPCPGLVLCSTATRTKQTIAALVNAWEKAPEIIYTHRLYLASPGELLKEIAKVNEAVTSVMVVAHNPGIESLAAMLVKDGNKQAYDRMRAKYPTAGLAMFTLESAWDSINPRSATLVDFITPGDIDDD